MAGVDLGGPADDLGGPMLEAVLHEIDSLEAEIKQLSRKMNRILMSKLRPSFSSLQLSISHPLPHFLIFPPPFSPSQALYLPCFLP